MASTHPPFDAELVAPLRELTKEFPATVTAALVPELRAVGAATRLTDEDLSRGGAVEISERAVAGPTGSPDVSLLICRPAELAAPAAAIFHTHGGGMMLGDNRTDMATYLDWVEQLGIIVVSVEYRLAPEHPDPAPIEDCYAGLVWTATHAEEIGIDPGRIVVAGISAGGGLAAGLSLLARDRGGPKIAGQMLMCPMLDDRNITPSSHELDGDGQWDRTSNLTGWNALLGERRGGPKVSPYAAPARATDLAGLPPALLDVGSVDLFRDETIDYAARIWRAAGVAELHVWPGGFHDFEQSVPLAVLSRASSAARFFWLRRLIAPA
jgi:acetyl esterase/lipase